MCIEKGKIRSSHIWSGLKRQKDHYLGTVRYLCLRGGRCLEWGGKIFKINEKGGCFFKYSRNKRGKLLETVVSTLV